MNSEFRSDIIVHQNRVNPLGDPIQVRQDYSPDTSHASTSNVTALVDESTLELLHSANLGTNQINTGAGVNEDPILSVDSVNIAHDESSSLPVSTYELSGSDLTTSNDIGDIAMTTIDTTAGIPKIIREPGSQTSVKMPFSDLAETRELVKFRKFDKLVKLLNQSKDADITITDLLTRILEQEAVTIKEFEETTGLKLQIVGKNEDYNPDIHDSAQISKPNKHLITTDNEAQNVLIVPANDKGKLPKDIEEANILTDNQRIGFVRDIT